MFGFEADEWKYPLIVIPIIYPADSDSGAYNQKVQRLRERPAKRNLRLGPAAPLVR